MSIHLRAHAPITEPAFRRFDALIVVMAKRVLVRSVVSTALVSRVLMGVRTFSRPLVAAA